jgi:DNA polymerase-3 subunit alpha
MKSQNIFWGIGSIKGIGEDTALQVIAERDKNGEYKDFDDFHDRHSFTGSKVKKQTYEALISSGAFDRLYHIKNESERGNLIKDFREKYGVKVANKEKDCYTVGEITQKWWWLLKQKELTGLADVNYSEIASTMEIDTKFFTQIELNTKQGFGIFRLFGGYIVECKVSKSKKGKFARLTIEHNYKLFKLIVWSDEYMLYEKELTGCEKSIIIFSANLKYEDKWTKGNQLTLTNKSILKVLK